MQATRRGRMGDLYAAIATGNIAGPSGARDLAASLDPDARGSVRHDPGDLRAIEERLQARKEKLQVPEAAPDASRLSSPELSLKVVPTRRSRASRGAVPGPGPARPGADPELAAVDGSDPPYGRPSNGVGRCGFSQPRTGPGGRSLPFH